MFCKPTYYPNGLRFGGCLENDGSAILDIYTILEIAGNVTIINADFVVSDGGNTVVLPTRLNAFIVLKNNGSTNDTLDPGSSPLEGGTTVTPTQSRSLLLISTGWVEVT